MFFPYNTDAPIYYWPYTTVVMIVVNVVVFAMEVSNPDLADSLSLQTGSGLHPVEWLTANFAHAGFMHLFGNMVFLWSFGLIVEGKLGWWKMLATYLGIGVLSSAIDQVLMLAGPEQYALGASGAIFGLMAMSIIWAPENSLECVLLIWVVPRFFELSVKVFVGIYLAWQVAIVFLTQATLSSEFLHTVGAVVGFVVGIWMVKTKRVDCENWDIFSIRAGRHRMTEAERVKEELNSPEFLQRKREQAQQKAAQALQWIREHAAAGNPLAALAVHRRMMLETPDWTLPEKDLCGLISAVDKAHLTAEAIPLMADYLARFAQHAVVMRIKLAQALLAEHRPAQSMKVLDKLGDSSLDARHLQIVQGIRAKAKKLHEDDPYEVADENW